LKNNLFLREVTPYGGILIIWTNAWNFIHDDNYDLVAHQGKYCGIIYLSGRSINYGLYYFIPAFVAFCFHTPTRGSIILSYDLVAYISRKIIKWKINYEILNFNGRIMTLCHHDFMVFLGTPLMVKLFILFHQDCT
jgi:hypothetical protein